ncbi:MAG: Gfo/Idh/MocA family oxidoreductase [Paracoccus denitrificans]|uniref:Gfo/Idh/MocA family oxidoreductase n=1 Tax=Paracoccus denitrificans TaxID=266 RepID=A0A533IEE0_PARDE|nr:MAG: Gfo/Idh/MocA family oxidoreductase [Paracoccus denitrificans]
MARDRIARNRYQPCLAIQPRRMIIALGHTMDNHGYSSLLEFNSDTGALMNNETRIAVVGAGLIGQTHIETIARTPQAVLAAIVEPSEQGTEIAKNFQTPLYRDLGAMIAAGGIDGAIVATPNSTHLPVAEALLNAGIPVLLEKPVAQSLEAAARLVSVTRSNDAPLLVGHHRRHNPLIKAARQAISQGAIGDLVVANVVTTLMKPDPYFDTAWRRSAGSGGPLLINLIHEVDLIRHFFGEVAEAQAQVANTRRGLEVEESAAVSLRLESGALVGMTISDAASGPWAWDLTAGENPTRFPSHPVSAHHYAGSAGGLSLPDLTLWRHPGAPDWMTEMVPSKLPVDPADPYIAQLKHFIDVIAGRDVPLITAADGSANMACIEAILEAARTGRTTRVDLSSLEG